MEPLAETTSGHVGAWNPHKANAPKPPVTAGEALSNTQQGSLVGTNNTNTNNAVNYPDVTLDSGRAVDSDDIHSARISGTEEDVTDSEHSVVPDYPLDSLQRPARTSTSSQHSQGTRQSHDSGNVESRTRLSHNSGNTETTRRLSQSSGNTEARTPRENTSSNVGTASASNVSASRPQQTQQAVSSQLNVPGSAAGMSQRTSGGVVVVPPAGSAAGMSQRTSGGVVVVPPVGHPRTVPHPSTSQPVVSHSNVSVNVTSAPTDDQNRHIRTQDLNIGVTSSRLDIQRQTAGALPDLIAHSQIPPPAGARPAVPAQRPQPPVDPRTGAYISRQGDPNGSRHRHHHGDRRHRSRRHSHRNSAGEAEEPCKETCFKCIAVSTSFRWILVVLSLMGVCCVVTGIVLAALHASGNSYLFLAIMFIGLGVLLVVVVGVGWKCTPRGHEPLHALFGLGDFRRHRSGRRRRSHHRREGRWHGGIMYPEFQFRRPPPSYTASMQEYQNQAAVTQQQPDTYDPENLPDEDYSLPSSPPPSYRSRASTVRAGIQITFPPNQGGDFPDSRPPTYRSHPSNTLPHGHGRPSLPLEDDGDPAPADIAFTDSVFVDTNTSETGTSIQIAPSTTGNQNVTVSVTTVTVSQSRPTTISNSEDSETPRGAPQVRGHSESVTSQGTDVFEVTDPVGDMEGDRVTTSL